jgi:hypothetical protein
MISFIFQMIIQTMLVGPVDYLIHLIYSTTSAKLKSVVTRMKIASEYLTNLVTVGHFSFVKNDSKHLKEIPLRVSMKRKTILVCMYFNIFSGIPVIQHINYSTYIDFHLNYS